MAILSPPPWPLAAILAILFAGCSSTPKSTGAIFYPPPPVEPRLQFLASFAAGEDISPASSFRKFVVGEEKQGRIVRAHGCAWWKKRLYVCDAGLPHVVVFDFEKREMRPLDPAQPAMFKKCVDIAIAPDGWKYITDTEHRKVIVYDDKDAYRTAFGKPDAWKPVGIAAAGDALYVTDVQNHQIVVLDRKTGAERGRYGSQGQAEGCFYFPLSITTGPDGDLYVSDTFNFRLQRLHTDGKFVRAYGAIGRVPGTFARPRGVAVDREGRIYAADAAFENIQIFDNEGHLLLFFGAPGDTLDSLTLPYALEVDYAAADTFRDRVASGYDIEYILFASSQTGPSKINVYGFLKKR